MHLQGYKGNSSQLNLLNKHGELDFLLQISDHCIVGNKQGKFQKKNCQLLFLGNHLNVGAPEWRFAGVINS